MKKILLIITIVLSCIIQVKAQNDTILTVSQIYNEGTGLVYVCADKYDNVVIYAEENCNDFLWQVTLNGTTNDHYENPLIISNIYYWAGCSYLGCNLSISFSLFILDANVPNETTTTLWKHQHETITLESIGADSTNMYNFMWNTGETTPNIDITEPGTYTCGISDMCATAVRTFIVKDNVEIELATCDLVTNLNMVTWQTTPAQAQYIDHVIVKRDGLNVGTANYSEGSFLDDIGSDLAQRTYTLTAVATDGTECPIVSYPKETIHMAYLTGVNNTIEVNWNTPTGYDLLGYNICEWTPNGKDGDLRVIDFVGASVTSYTCQASQFTSGYVIIQGVEASKPESRLLSNRSSETVDVGEYGMEGFKVYPNPTSGVFTVEGGGHLSVMNLLGQEILAQEIEGKTTLELPKGIYLMRLGSANRKIVVE